jgi:type I restriction enzyme S subunit
MLLGDVSKIKTGNLDVNAKVEIGRYPFFTCAQKPEKINSYSFDCECVLVAGNGDLNVKYYKGKFDVYQRTYVVEVLQKDRLNTRFLFYFLNKYLVRLRSQSIGGVIKYIKMANLTDIELPEYPLKKQKQIIQILDTADNLRQKRKEQLVLLDDYLKSVFLDMFGDPVINPKNWTTKELSKVGDLDRGISKNRPRNAPELLGGPYPLIQTGDVSNSGGYIKEFKQTYSKLGLMQSKIWPIGTLCITIAANIAKTGILTFKACFPDSVVGFTSNNLVRTEYVQWWMVFLQKILEEKATESAQKNINLGILRSLDIPVPPIELQNKFALIIEQVEKTKQKMCASLEEMNKNFNALMQRYFK